MAVTRPVTVEAVGDDFALVDGLWLSGARMARHLRQAHRAWAFVAQREEEIPALIAGLKAGPDEWIIGISPGIHEGWPIGDREAIYSLASVSPSDAPLCGLLLAIDASNCGECGAGCTHCGTNDPAAALYGQHAAQDIAIDDPVGSV